MFAVYVTQLLAAPRSLGLEACGRLHLLIPPVTTGGDKCTRGCHFKDYITLKLY